MWWALGGDAFTSTSLNNRYVNVPCRSRHQVLEALNEGRHMHGSPTSTLQQPSSPPRYAPHLHGTYTIKSTYYYGQSKCL